MPIKTSDKGYILIKRYDYYGNPAIPTGNVEGDKAEFLCIVTSNPERKVWLQREEIM